MPSKLDEISVKIGELSAGMRYQAAESEKIRRDMEANSSIQTDRHDENRNAFSALREENRAALAELSRKLDGQITTVALMQPIVAALELSRLKLAKWASVGLAAVALLGWLAEVSIKWLFSWILTKLGG
jgi:hypothetical protein